MADANVTADAFLEAVQTGNAEANKHLNIRLWMLYRGASPFTLFYKCNFSIGIATIIVAKCMHNQMNRVWVTMMTVCL